MKSEANPTMAKFTERHRTIASILASTLHYKKKKKIKVSVPKLPLSSSNLNLKNHFYQTTHYLPTNLYSRLEPLSNNQSYQINHFSLSNLSNHAGLIIYQSFYASNPGDSTTSETILLR